MRKDTRPSTFSVQPKTAQAWEQGYTEGIAIPLVSICPIAFQALGRGSRQVFRLSHGQVHIRTYRNSSSKLCALVSVPQLGVKRKCNTCCHTIC